MPEEISTSYVERSNLSIRMASRRFTRLTNGFSKKLENHAAAVSLYVAHYNWCRAHESLTPDARHQNTPAMAKGQPCHSTTDNRLRSRIHPTFPQAAGQVWKAARTGTRMLGQGRPQLLGSAPRSCCRIPHLSRTSLDVRQVSECPKEKGPAFTRGL
jgi:hypothetical protein